MTLKSILRLETGHLTNDAVTTVTVTNKLLLLNLYDLLHQYRHQWSACCHGDDACKDLPWFASGEPY